jgi:lipopolysaccharide/colanic/teichoic acid biosynthesis glycosyltransferase
MWWKMSGTSAQNIEPREGLPRCFDFVASLAAFIVLSVPLAIVSCLIKVTSGGMVFFRQERVGKNGKIFVLYKFRTMKENSTGLLITKGGDRRVTFLGKILRRTKIDEIPQLINVLKGDMSIVGPRPEVSEYVDLNSQLWQAVLKVRPGITDPVTLKLRNEEELLRESENPHCFYKDVLLLYKLNGYISYLLERTCVSDIKVIFSTLIAVLIPSLMPPPRLEDIKAGWRKGR